MGAAVSVSTSKITAEVDNRLENQGPKTFISNDMRNLNFVCKDTDTCNFNIQQKNKLSSKVVFDAILDSLTKSLNDASARAKVGLGGAVSVSNAETANKIKNSIMQSCGVTNASNTMDYISLSAIGSKNADFVIVQDNDIDLNCAINSAAKQITETEQKSVADAQGASLLDLLGGDMMMWILLAGVVVLIGGGILKYKSSSKEDASESKKNRWSIIKIILYILTIILIVATVLVIITLVNMTPSANISYWPWYNWVLFGSTFVSLVLSGLSLGNVI